MLALNWLSLSLIAAAFQGVLLCLGLWSKGEKQARANQYLVVLVLSVVISLLLRLTYSESNYIFYYYPHLTIAGDFVLFLIGPALYFYVRTLLDQSFRWQKKYWLHGIPLGLFILSYVYLLTMSREELLLVHANGKINMYYISMFNVAIGQIIIYAVLSLRILARYEHQFVKLNAKDHKTGYLRKVLWALLGVAFCWIIGHLRTVLPGFDQDTANLLYQISFLLLSLLIFVVAYYAIRAPEIFSIDLSNAKTKYQSSKLNPAQALMLKDQLLRLLKEEKPYLNPNLSLKELAEKLDVNQVYLSQTINEHCGKHFYDLINSYRVQAFIQKAQSGEYSNYTLLAIAMESGFKAKTSFNKAFKKETGTTPSAFLRQSMQNSRLRGSH